MTGAYLINFTPENRYASLHVCTSITVCEKSHAQFKISEWDIVNNDQLAQKTIVLLGCCRAKITTKVGIVLVT
jgi:hypothetical protein